VSKAALQWLASTNIYTTPFDLGTPWHYGMGESFNGEYCDLRLSLEWFGSRMEVRLVIGTWRRHCNEVRPQSRLG
jgi:putative transposase